MKPICFPLFFIGVALLLSCKDDAGQPACKAPQMVNAQSTCLNSVEGITLQASDYGTPQQPIQFTWNVYMLKDTAKTANLNDARVEKLTSSDALTIPLYVLQASGKVVVRVESNCDGNILSSPYFAFVKRTITPSCSKWETQK